ncbi:hypothetical protein ACFLXQ_01385 [Chloroflexota bacterium]
MSTGSLTIVGTGIQLAGHLILAAKTTLKSGNKAEVTAVYADELTEPSFCIMDPNPDPPPAPKPSEEEKEQD